MITNHSNSNFPMTAHFLFYGSKGISYAVFLSLLVITMLAWGCGSSVIDHSDELNSESDNNNLPTENNQANTDTNAVSENSDQATCELDLDVDECIARGCNAMDVKVTDLVNQYEDMCNEHDYRSINLCFAPGSISDNAEVKEYIRYNGELWQAFIFPNGIRGEHDEFILCEGEEIVMEDITVNCFCPG